MKRLSLREFGQVVRRVLKTLPAELKPYLQNVVVDVEDKPGLKLLRAQGFSEEEIADGESIYGLFDPLPIAGEGLDFHEAPHRLIIFKRPLEEDFPEPDQLMIEIRKTVIHELAHHFGYTDRDLEKFDETPDPFASEFLEKETVVHLARMGLASLWLSQTARVLADNCLRLSVVLLVAGSGALAAESAWYQVAPFFVLPFILLAPVNGALSNGLAKGRALAGSCACCLGVTLLLTLILPYQAQAGWWWCGGLLLNMLGAAVYSPTRYALLPAAAEDAQIPLPRINGWIEMGGAAAVVGGFFLAVELRGQEVAGIPTALAAVVVLNVLSLLAALPVGFPSDVTRPQPLGQSLLDFFRDARRTARDPEALGSMLGLAGLMALVFSGTGAIFAVKGVFEPSADPSVLLEALALVAAGAAAGSLLASFQAHPYRMLGLVAFGAVGLALAFFWALAAADPRWPSFALGFMGGLANVPLRAAYQAAVPAESRGNAMAVSNTANYLLQSLLAGLLFALVRLELLTPAGQVGVLATLALAAALASCWLLRRPTFEHLVEFVIRTMFRIRAHGPGVHRVPPRGPLLVLANHTVWLDPFLLAAVIPRRLIPMMTSDFYDLPGVHWLMANLLHPIRVQAATFRREAPELAEAIAALDRGECVVVYPEGRLRRTPQPTVRQFGRGIWHLLSQRPQTPVVVCWVEGGWGSFTSYAGGRPMQNKRPDFRRSIDIGISEPQVLPAELLADVRATRRHLMEACLNARGYLGLEVPSLEEEKDDEEKREE